jgi:23S rRNA pseudouridine2457 synthase
MKNHLYYKLHKPVSVVSQFIREQKRKKKLLGDLYDFPKGVMAIGRLDEKSEGLLLLTTNGKESHRICSSGIEKEYYVQVDGLITKEALLLLNSGVEIGIKGKKYITKPCVSFEVKETPDFGGSGWKIRDERHGPTSWVSITITEGKFRQVRKMTAAVGFPTLRLVRVRIDNILLGNLKSGDVEEMPKF